MEQQSNSTVQPYHLVVIHPFGEHAKGAVVRDAEEAAGILAGENARHVNKIAAQ